MISYYQSKRDKKLIMHEMRIPERDVSDLCHLICLLTYAYP